MQVSCLSLFKADRFSSVKAECLSLQISSDTGVSAIQLLVVR